MMKQEMVEFLETKLPNIARSVFGTGVTQHLGVGLSELKEKWLMSVDKTQCEMDDDGKIVWFRISGTASNTEQPDLAYPMSIYVTSRSEDGAILFDMYPEGESKLGLSTGYTLGDKWAGEGARVSEVQA